MHRLRDESYAEDLLEMQAEKNRLDVVEVVRCRDCQYSEEINPDNKNAFYRYCKRWEGATQQDGFCYRGEPR